MIKDNRVYFGYGTISVCVRSDKIIFEELEPCYPIGKCCTVALQKAECKLTGKSIKLNLEDLYECIIFSRHLDKVGIAGGDNIFTFKDIIFDFSNYNPESVRVVKEKLQIAMSLFTIALAA